MIIIVVKGKIDWVPEMCATYIGKTVFLFLLPNSILYINVGSFKNATTFWHLF